MTSDVDSALMKGDRLQLFAYLDFQKKRAVVGDFGIGHDLEMLYRDSVVDQHVIGIAARLPVMRGPRAGMAATGDEVVQADLAEDVECLAVRLDVEVAAEHDPVAGFGDHGGTESIGFKLEREHADAAIQDPRFTRAPYVGQHGWISMDVKGVRDWGEVRALVLESYRLIAPKALWARVWSAPG